MTNPFDSFILLFLLMLLSWLPSIHSQASEVVLDDTTIHDAVKLWHGNLRDQAVVLSLYGGPIEEWDTSRVTNFAGLFRGQSRFNADISQWDTSKVTSMRDCFSGCSNYNPTEPLLWDTSKVTTMARMFRSASTFDGDLTNFDTSSVTDISFMAHRATMFQGRGLASWDTSRIQFTSDAFSRATNFNEPIQSWNTSSIVSFQNTFRQAVSFNQDLSSWNVASVMTFHNMFQGALSLHQTLCWDTLVTALHKEISIDRSAALDPFISPLHNLLCDSPVQLDPCCVDAQIMQDTCCQPKGCSMECKDTANSTVPQSTPPTVAPTVMASPYHNTTTITTTSSPVAAAIDNATATDDDDDATLDNTEQDEEELDDIKEGDDDDSTPKILPEGFMPEEDDIHETQPHDKMTTEDTATDNSGATQLTTSRASETETNDLRNNVWILTGSIVGGVLLVLLIILTVSWLRPSSSMHPTQQLRRSSDDYDEETNTLHLTAHDSGLMVPLEGLEALMDDTQNFTTVHDSGVVAPLEGFDALVDTSHLTADDSGHLDPLEGQEALVDWSNANDSY
ncbi:(Lipo)protein [Seminavis robusta]|uniref:(Lipo)protein n=1 Tax=Seminavis robusta TaxID=568900 RepID=A0A9N8DJ18_9STRA|nr:(Lipo)protein [Seminavis robusta]|eukprot:Sro148_g068140.1 (Lipo)protein (564) ;mRNA; r:56400-58201